MSFRVLGLSPELFHDHFAMSDAELAAIGARRLVADGTGYPCRVSVAHIEPGDEVLLLNFEHQPKLTPYRSRHAIYVGRGSLRACDVVDEIPEAIRPRLVSVRAFDAAHMMIEADVVEGAEAAPLFERLLADPKASYLQVHYAKRGCYAAWVERA